MVIDIIILYEILKNKEKLTKKKPCSVVGLNTLIKSKMKQKCYNLNTAKETPFLLGIHFGVHYPFVSDSGPGRMSFQSP